LRFLAGTGARIDEARRVRWQDINLERGRVYLRGTKSETSDRWLNLPDWLVEQLAARAADCGAEGYVFAAPASATPSGCGTRATARERFAPLWTRAA
jgi:integrase